MVLNLIPRQLAQSSARLYSAKAAPKEASSAPLPGFLPKGQTKVSTLPSGVVVASLENNSPLTNVAIALKAGSRYEGSSNLGVAHALRAYAGLHTKNATVFGITRNLQLIGASLSATTSREHMVYSLQCVRDHLDTGLHFLSEVTTKQAFRPWQIEDFLPRIQLDLALLQEHPQVIMIEALHKAAFRTGLGNSIYCPKHRVGSHDSEVLSRFVQEHYTAGRTAVIGVGIAHEDLTDYANSLEFGTGSVGADATKYGGGEIRIDMKLPFTYAAVAAEGVSLKDPKEVIAAGILQSALGTLPNIKRGESSSKLMQAAGKVIKNPFAVSCINANYTDSGLFGFYVVGQPKDMGSLVKAVVEQYNAVAKAGISDADLQRAKHKVKAEIHMAGESNSDVLEEMGLQLLTTGKYLESAEIDKLVDSVTAANVNAIAKKVVAGKPSMAAVGELTHTPFLDQLR